jgi:O-antigen ligase
MKLLLTCILLVCCGALYFSYARGAWLAFVVAIAGYWLIRQRLLFLSFFVFFFLCVGAVLYLSSNDRYLKFSNDFKTTIMHESFSEHFAATYQLKDASTAERFYRWVAGVRMIEDSWKTGFGPSTFYSQYKSYTQPAFKTWVSKNEEQSTVHNYFLLLIIEQGAIGLVLFIALMAGLFWYAQKIYHRTEDRFWKICSATVAAILLMECAVNFLSDMIEADKAGTVFYLCVAALIIADIKTRKPLQNDSVL